MHLETLESWGNHKKMTEERFELAYNDDWWAVRDGGITLWKEEVIYLMNQLNDENIKLKQEIEYYKLCQEEDDRRSRIIDKYISDNGSISLEEYHNLMKYSYSEFMKELKDKDLLNLSGGYVL